ncbi:BCCT family transporter [Oceanospirillaceae bacterium G-43]|uniref:BCCT family transporter n=2 Tax=Parathalassolituus penaei TaxID=2997323 RepID=A0A9X3EGV9_9GAMM|nr:BCCT family transporter [Parathalassolituus penaei]MCY0967332.1 BCCT family transporter [Parathalassolituus penaei]
MSPSEIKALQNKYQTDFKAGQDNYTLMGMDLHRSVFTVSAVLIIAFVLGTLLYPEQAGGMLSASKSWAIDNFDWLFMVGCNVFLVFCLALIFLPVGRLRLGGENASPEHSTWSWFAMLFAAGMGIGLMFWSVAEPVAYYTNWYGTPLNVEAKTPEGAALALGTTLFHWALHPWAIYGVVGLALAFFAYNKGMPLTIRSAFYPLLGERVWGWAGDVIDILAVLATVFGLATSLGLGAQQATSGLNFLFGVADSLTTQIIVIIAVTGVATLSVSLGMDKGVKILSNLNMVVAFALMILVFLLGPTAAILKWIGVTVASYATNIVPLSNWIGREDSDWYHGWTVFYWAWWVSWSPFVGMFIARISRGRTVREFIIAVLIVPTIVSALWMSVFGGTAIEQVIAGTGELANGITNVSLSMFQMFEQLPLAGITSFTAVILVLLFFVTSADSGALVVDSITAGGKLTSPIPQRVFWASIEGVIAIALLIGGGKAALSALQAGSIATGLPFTAVLLLMCLSLYKGLDNELRIVRLKQQGRA